MSSPTAQHTGEFRVPTTGKRLALPAQLTRLVGREQEVADVRRHLASSRLLTITGAGGSGKTRLALEVATRAAPEFEHGVAWVELAGVGDGEHLADYVASAIGARLDGSISAEDAMAALLRGQNVLLVLDNCEHIVEACARLIERLLRRCTGLRVLATSREALGIGGERSWLVPVLSLPPTPQVAAAEALRSAAVQLFVERAQDAQPSFALTDANSPAVAQICRRVDGLPLAIELAAARVRVLTPEQIAKRLDDGFRVLDGANRKTLPRHRTLHEAIDWSYRLLDAPERMLLDRLSVFAGEWSLEAAESVCASTPVESAEILDRLAALVDKSLVTMREVEGTGRYRLLETIRQYAADRLAANGSASVQARHARFNEELLREMEPELITPRRRGAVATVERELDNVRAALLWTRHHDVPLHLRMTGRLTWVWYSLGLWSEGRQWLVDALALPDAQAPTRDRAAALFGAGAIATLLADSARGRGWLEECLTITDSIGDDRLKAYASNYLGMAYAGQGMADGDSHVEWALRWFREAGDLYGLRLALLLLATSRLTQGDIAASAAFADEAVAVARVFGLERELGIALQVFGVTVLQRGDFARADELMRESLRLLQRDPQPMFIGRGLDLLGVIACRRGDPLTGARYFGAGAAEREHIGAGLWHADRERVGPQIEAARRAVGPTAFAAASEEGSRLGLSLIEAGAGETGGSERRDVGSSGGAPTPRLRVATLGALEIRLDGVAIPADAWRYARPRELLLYLLTNPQGRTREQVGLVFWPDASAAQVKNNFHVTLHHIRKVLGPEWIVFEQERYRVNDRLGAELDADVFERNLTGALREPGEAARRVGRLTAALALYRGDFLEEAAAGDWHLEPRERLRRRWVDGMLALGEALTSLGRHADAADVYRQLVAREDLHEEAYRRLMASLAKAGERQQAARAYERLTTLLRDDLDAEPETATVAVFEQLRRAVD